MPPTVPLITSKKACGLSLLIWFNNACDSIGATALEPAINFPKLSWATVKISAPASGSSRKVDAAVPVSIPDTTIV